MKCWQCGREAEGTCRFCGRGVCKEDTESMSFILTVYTGRDQLPKALAVADVLYCGVCKPQPSPITLPAAF
jgi:hypothetical protein